ncbi:molybdopterin molybdotransferase [Kushneria sinocarnis]|uniref:Molybdopterin molybdenumtransferase n=1 Tax=Kushneria sinocarnis TaxID=595502 RepID=A0A420WYJ9_9GAMM|nr:molybdopterin molybdotransferase [Kushneria sinocarnis]
MHDPATALTALLDGVMALESESVALTQAHGRTLADTVTALMDTPPADNSAMDGYAIRAADAGRTLPVSQRIPAGHAPAPLAPGTCARIFTGAVIPEGADSVVRQEVVEESAEGAAIPGPVTAGNSVRRRGREMQRGATLLEAGTRLNAAAVGFLASQGYDRVAVRRRPRVSLLVTGDELVEPGRPLSPGQIYNSNAPMLAALLSEFGAEVVASRHVADSLDATVAALADAAEGSDVVVTSGGVSIGEEDHVRNALQQLGTLDLWRLSIKPGKPLALGRIKRGNGGETRFVGLAGNPVSSYVGAWLFLRPLMGALLARPDQAALPALRARAGFETSTERRANYMRVSLTIEDDQLVAHAFADQDSSVLHSCVQADGLAVIPAWHEIAPGDMIDVLRLQP